IKALNPGSSLPSTAITVIHRSDSSGTTAGFTGFLAAADPEFKSKVGEGKDVQWPTGTGAKGNAGVAGAVQQTAGAIGYVEQAYALQHKFTYAAVKNAAGKFTSQTFIIVNKDLCKAGLPGGESAAKGVVGFIDYGLGEGQGILSEADYAALPSAILAKSKEAVQGLECNGAPIEG